jgi:hypothetical protein
MKESDPNLGHYTQPVRVEWSGVEKRAGGAKASGFSGS